MTTAPALVADHHFRWIRRAGGIRSRRPLLLSAVERAAGQRSNHGAERPPHAQPPSPPGSDRHPSDVSAVSLPLGPDTSPEVSGRRGQAQLRRTAPHIVLGIAAGPRLKPHLTHPKRSRPAVGDSNRPRVGFDVAGGSRWCRPTIGSYRKSGELIAGLLVRVQSEEQNPSSGSL
jgi:hypothetical protein